MGGRDDMSLGKEGEGEELPLRVKGGKRYL